MNKKQTNECTAFLGIDGGGSKCSARIILGDKGIEGHGLSGPANPSQGFDQAIHSILASTRLAMEDAGLDYKDVGFVVAGIGLAGVNINQFYQAICAWQHPYKNMFVISDLYAACLGAHGGQDGAVIITGTGSCGFAHVGGKSLEFGGHGFPHGDKGSGAWIGLEAFKILLLEMEGLQTKSRLTERLKKEYKGQALLSIVESMMPVKAPQFARLAPLVFEMADQGDEQAISIIQDGANYLSMIANKLLQLKPPRFSLLGGLAHLMTPWLDKNIVNVLSPPSGTPEQGAIYFAKRQMKLLEKKAV